MSIGRAYLDTAINGFKSMKTLGDKTLAQLDISQLNCAPDPESNSISIIVKHMRGNMLSRWTDFLTTDGEKTNRNRDEEFIGEYTSKIAVVTAWEEGWKTVFDTLSSLEEEDLLKTIKIRGQSLTVLQAIQRQVSHYSNHVGQMIYLGKWLKKEQWESLSIPRGKSEEFLQSILKEHGK